MKALAVIWLCAAFVAGVCFNQFVWSVPVVTSLTRSFDLERQNYLHARALLDTSMANTDVCIARLVEGRL